MALFRNDGVKLPHRLRVVLLLLRVALGLDLFYLGWTINTDPAAADRIAGRSLGSLYVWLTGNPWNGLGPVFVWITIIVGVCLMIGLFMRTAGTIAFALAMVAFLPNLRAGTLGIGTLVGPDIVFMIGLLVLIFGNAGTYFGLDQFIHVRLFGKK